MKKSELDSIIKEVQQVMDAAVQTEAKNIRKLAKAHDGEDTSSEVPPDDSASAPQPDMSSPPPGADASASASLPAPPPGDPSGAPPSDPAAAAPPPGDPAAAGGDGQDGGSNPQELEAAYAALPLHELQMHYLAAKAAVVSALSSDGGAGADPGADAAGAPPPPDAAGGPPPGAGGPPPTMKTEKGAELPSDKKANGENPMDKVTKSESTIKALQKTLDEQGEALVAQGKALGDLVAAVKKVVEVPVRKAIVSIAEVPRTSPTEDISMISRADALDRLKVVAQKPLSKSDRERITSFALGNINIDGVKDLLVPSPPPK